MTEVVVAGTKADAASSTLKSAPSSSSTSTFFTRSRKPAPPLDDAAVAEGALVPRSSQDAGLVSGTDNAPVLDDGAESFARSQVNSFQNQLHVKIDWIAAIAAYGFGSAMHVHGQSTGLCTLSMWLAGNAFIMNSQYRGVYGPTSDAFRYESMASWIWMLASFQQFRQTKVLKYAGFSSWTGFGCVAYFSTRHLTNMVTMPAAA
ncbi:Hypothetical protein, putative [Bodo saltans]|uniref:Uncharacterized protein n=1 Tax=Bodo saltans TaxID=75058 RepID=A0A0S4IU20_BODSA|nr:Hypothetical protein, putative [Bodo saltans]|eukprot:CUE83523.1 Hypothetical protein, putative [Bodo saltans]